MKRLILLLMLISIQFTLFAQGKPPKLSLEDYLGKFPRISFYNDLLVSNKGAPNLGLELFLFKKLSIRGELLWDKERIKTHLSEVEEWNIDYDRKEVKLGLCYFPFKHPKNWLKRKKRVRKCKKTGCIGSKALDIQVVRQVLQGIYIGGYGVYRKTEVAIQPPKNINIPEGLELDLDELSFQKGGTIALGYATRLKSLQLDFGMQATFLIWEGTLNPVLNHQMTTIHSDFIDLGLSNVELEPFVKIGLAF